MEPLYNYIVTPANSSPNWDGHRHLFSHRGLNTLEFGKCVGFIDIEFDHLDKYEDIPGLYDKYLPDIPSYNKILASGLTIDDIKKIYNAHQDRIAGFGELKLYDVFNDKPVNFKRISFARDVCKFSEDVGCLPVYIHYEIENIQHIKVLDNLLRDFPDVPIILCHCGMNTHNQEFAWGAVKKLATEHGNCWLDVSWDAAQWLADNPMLIMQLPRERIFWGSDTSPRLKAHGFKSASIKDIYSWRNEIKSFMDSDANLMKLFNTYT